ncbi:MAG: Methyltransferase type 12 [Methanomicrobiales archaeon 53_19]|uniref:class I SAM-dependent methyltransferase n=1 Tax=Methanocalculus sp. TaxID=2004547 RepID=UPI00074AA1A5|nr:class I SAM-dependent methyltransferase [Methanocalculus sp.]KUK70561.1 MAG: Methyltransferase type 12 [Methanocalculus sp. 52_23]KUL05208.1 MAG: Methyltransferase type 12 [Methanomicrobiales archaeon 53_19]HIJ05789.1 class I SAM-dependent methyltransferase [Methanocalculus sp.]
MDKIINWNELWKAIHASSRHRVDKESDPGKIWDKKAAAYNRITNDEKESTKQELSMLDLSPTDTVLDVGAGNGRLAVPIAGMVSHVTALDASEGMLSHLEQRMAAEGRTNYSVVVKRWEDVVIGSDIPVHDVVIAAFSLGIYDVGAALQKMDAAARRSVHLFWHMGEWREPEEMALYIAVHGEESTRHKGYPDALFLVNILHGLRIYADIRIYHALWETVYDSPEEAAEQWITMHAPDFEDLDLVTRHFSERLRKDDAGKFHERSVRTTAMVSWKKGE